MSARNLDVLWGLGLIVLAAVFYSQTLGAFAETPLARNPMAIPDSCKACWPLGASC